MMLTSKPSSKPGFSATLPQKTSSKPGFGGNSKVLPCKDCGAPKSPAAPKVRGY